MKQCIFLIVLKKSTFGGLHKLQDTSCLITACGEQLCLGEALLGATEGRRTQALILKPLKTFPVPVFDTPPPEPTVSPLVPGN